VSGQLLYPQGKSPIG